MDIIQTNDTEVSYAINDINSKINLLNSIGYVVKDYSTNVLGNQELLKLIDLNQRMLNDFIFEILMYTSNIELINKGLNEEDANSASQYDIFSEVK